MQGLADGYFIIPYTIGNYLASTKQEEFSEDVSAAKEAVANVNCVTKKLLNANGKRTVDSFHRELGKIVWDYCGMTRSAAGLKKAAGLIGELREDFWKNVRVLGSNEDFNQSLEKAGRVADFFELAELMCIDALNRNESCGGHFREEYQTPEGEALRDDANFSYVAAWGYQGHGRPASLTKEPLAFNYVKPSQRSYK
jgi:succinate dehydrogenase / fumarate reductase flavoprotein subunit